MCHVAQEAGAPVELQPGRTTYIQFCPNLIFSNVENAGVSTVQPLIFSRLLVISSSSGEERESLFLFQRISVTMQRFTAILLHNCFVRDDQDLWSSHDPDGDNNN